MTNRVIICIAIFLGMLINAYSQKIQGPLEFKEEPKKGWYIGDQILTISELNFLVKQNEKSNTLLVKGNSRMFAGGLFLGMGLGVMAGAAAFLESNGSEVPIMIATGSAIALPSIPLFILGSKKRRKAIEVYNADF